MMQSGRGNWLLISVVAVLAAIGVVIATAGETPTTATARFMTALAKGDAQTLTDMSYFNPPRSREQVLEAWKKTLQYGKFYVFSWRVTEDTRPSPGHAKVGLQVAKDANSQMAYEEPFSVDLVQQNGKWLVDVRSISRPMYPSLPR